mgnify:CR=1 FL=1
MARFGQGFINSLTQPSYMQGMFTAAQQAGSMPARAKEKKEQSALMQMVNAAIASNDPAALAQASQAASGIDRELSLKLAQAAQQATKEQQGLTVKNEEKRAGLGIQGGLSAIQQGAARGLTLDQLSEGVRSVVRLGGTQEDINKAYKAGLESTKPKSSYQNVSPGGVVLQDGKVVYQAPFKPEKPSTKKPTISVQKTDSEILTFEDGVLIERYPINDKTDAEAAVSFGTINKTSELLSTVASAKQKLEQQENSTFNASEGLSGQLLSNVGGTTAYSLRNNEYLTLSGQEAMREIGRLKEEAEKVGSRGTGLGQITQVEFSALQSNLAALNTGLSYEDQVNNLDKIERNLLILQRQAAGEDIMDLIDFNQPSYISSGYTKKNGTLFYFPPNSDEEYYYDETGKKFLSID